MPFNAGRTKWNSVRWIQPVTALILFLVPAWPVVAQPPFTQTTSPFPEFFPDYSVKERHILTELDRQVSLDLKNDSLDGFREAIMERHRFNIVIDRVRLEEEAIATDATDITLHVSDVTLRSAIRLVLRQNNLAFIIDHDVMTITTETIYESERLTRTYPVRDLVGENTANYQLLIDAVKKGVTPGGWTEPSTSPAVTGAVAPLNIGIPPPKPVDVNKKAVGPPCTVAMVPASGSLVIHQSWEGHDEVLKLLRALRKARNLSPLR